MAAGLLLSGLANLAFSQTTSLGWLAVIWALNGWFQSMGFPAGARLLSHYYEPKQYGRSWTIFGCSHQVGACIILVAGGYLGCSAGGIFSSCRGRWRCLLLPASSVVLRDVPHKNKELTGDCEAGRSGRVASRTQPHRQESALSGRLPSATCSSISSLWICSPGRPRS